MNGSAFSYGHDVTVDHPSDYGDTFARVYDSWYGSISDVEATIEALEDLADGRRVVELGVGTGRLALPLAQRGLEVLGVDASRAMLDRCRKKPGAAALRLIQADMAAIPLGQDADVGVVFVAFNTLFNITSEHGQQSCIEGVRTMLSGGGSFLVEAFVPSPEPPEPQYRESPRPDGSGGRILTTSLRDPRHQTVRGVHIHTANSGAVTRLPWAIRYLHPTQLDRLCGSAGLELVERWSSWHGDHFDGRARRHVSHYRPVAR